MSILFVTFGAVALVGFAFFISDLSRKVRARVNEASEGIKKKGYAIEDIYLKPVGYLCRIWGTYDQPIPFYLQVSNLDPVSVLVGQLGICDISVGDEIFDQVFVVRTNNEENARKILTEQVRQTFLSYDKIRFRTGAISTLLDADYFREQKSDRDLRNLWMIDASKPISQVDADSLLKFAQELAKQVENISSTWNAEINLRSNFFEGR